MAVMWSAFPLTDEGSIKDILRRTYGTAIGSWKLTAAYALSADGITVAGKASTRMEKGKAGLPPFPPATRRSGARHSQTRRAVFPPDRHAAGIC